MTTNTDTIDKLFLELSQFTKATTGTELKLQAGIMLADAHALELSYQLEKCAPSKKLAEAHVMVLALRKHFQQFIP